MTSFRQRLGRGHGPGHLHACSHDGDVAAFPRHRCLTELDFVLAVGYGSALAQQPLVGHEDGRVLALQQRGPQQPLGVRRGGRHGDLQARRVPVPGLRAAGVLHPSAAADAVAHEVGDRGVGLAAGVGVGNGGLVVDLRDRLVRKGRCPDVHQRPKPGHGRAGGDAAVAQLGDGRGLDAVAVPLAHRAEPLRAGSRAHQPAADQHHPPILLHGLGQCLDQSLSQGHFSRHGSVTLPAVPGQARNDVLGARKDVLGGHLARHGYSPLPAYAYLTAASGGGSGLVSANCAAASASRRTSSSTRTTVSRSHPSLSANSRA